MNREQRRKTERKLPKDGTNPVQILKSLANLDGVANLSTQITEFLAASQRMEAIADKLDQAEVLEDLSTVRDLATSIKDQVEGILAIQERHDKVLSGILHFLGGCYPGIPAHEDLDLLKSELRGT
jgi:hypothetical protein